MKVFGALMAVAMLAAQAASAQPIVVPPPPPLERVPPTRAQLLDLLAPVALYPDELLADILMAAEYPVQVVQADRVVADAAANGGGGQGLYDFVTLQAWNPAVKSLTAFPQVLRTMDSHIDWTEALGRAFMVDPAAAMDAVQDLRHRALTAGALRSTPQQVVNVDGNIITISPAAPDAVAYPAYDPGAVYGPWPYPDAPPVVFTDIYDGCSPGYFGTCWFDLAVVAPFWGWNRWDWGHHRHDFDSGRYGALNRPGAGRTMAVPPPPGVAPPPLAMGQRQFRPQANPGLQPGAIYPNSFRVAPQAPRLFSPPQRAAAPATTASSPAAPATPRNPRG